MSRYSWGDDSGDSRSSGGSEKAPGEFGYESARKAYVGTGAGAGSGRSAGSGSGRADEESRRDYDFSSARGKTPWPIKRPVLAVKTESTHPAVICADDTGSFKREICIILEKLALLGMEVGRYMPTYELCLALVGDTTCDSFPLQIQDFDKGPALDPRLKALFPEGGGGDAPESYDLAAYYFTNHCEMPNAVKPLFIWVLDATTRTKLLAAHVRKYIGDDLQSDLDSVEVLKKLADKFTVYVIFKGGSRDRKFWEDIYGEQSIIPMEEPRDIIELMIGIFAGEAGKYADFEMRSSKRHSDRPDRVSRVMKSTRSAKDKSAAATEGGGKAEHASGKSAGGSLKSKKLV